ncbi:MAG: LD-carboxypeptidase [Bacteroidota bacterium]|jgi:muramoyltetrapeptide carboxypeptidase
MRRYFRRDFLKLTGLAALMPEFSGFNMPASSSRIKRNPVLPKRLKAGDRVALIAPGSPPSDEKLALALSNLTSLGFQVREGAHLRKKNGYLAGTDADRLSDLHQAFSDPDIDAVWCARGGYGCARLLPGLDFNVIRDNPKVFIGYSDITALHIAIHQQTGLATFHGPVAVSDLPAVTLDHLSAVVLLGEAPHRIQAAHDPLAPPHYQPFTIAPGRAEGTLTGGNLALLSALAGTPFAPVFKDKIVFIEDVGEKPYRIDRMITQLLQATDLRKAAGIALGIFDDCDPDPGSPSLTLRETLGLCLGNLGIPVFYGLPFGHIQGQCTLPYGVKAELNADVFSLVMPDSAVLSG